MNADERNLLAELNAAVDDVSRKARGGSLRSTKVGGEVLVVEPLGRPVLPVEAGAPAR